MTNTSFSGRIWTPAETSKLKSLVRQGLSIERIQAEFPARSPAGVHRKHSRLLQELSAKTRGQTQPAQPRAALNITASDMPEKTAGHPFQSELNALATGQPIQYSALGGKPVWQPLGTNPHASVALIAGDTTKFQFRVQAPSIVVNGIEIKAPCSIPLAMNTAYYVPSVSAAALVLAKTWVGSEFDRLALDRGLVHLAETTAIAHSKAMLHRQI